MTVLSGDSVDDGRLWGVELAISCVGPLSLVTCRVVTSNVLSAFWALVRRWSVRAESFAVNPGLPNSLPRTHKWKLRTYSPNLSSDLHACATAHRPTQVSPLVICGSLQRRVCASSPAAFPEECGLAVERKSHEWGSLTEGLEGVLGVTEEGMAWAGKEVRFLCRNGCRF